MAENKKAGQRVLFAVVLTALIGATLWVPATKTRAANPAASSPQAATDTEPGNAPAAAAPGASEATGAETVRRSIPATSGTLTLSLPEFLRMMKDRNEELFADRLEWTVKKERVNAAEAIYEPTLTASVEREKNHVQNSTEERINRNNEAEFREYNNLWSAGVEGLTPLGGTYRLGYDMDDLSNSLRDFNTDRDPFTSEYRTFLGIDITQPLLKNAGVSVTEAEIHIAEANADMGFQDYRQSLLNRATRAGQLYWQFYGAREKLAMRKRSRAIAADVLSMNRKRYAAGKIDYSGVLDAEAGLKLRQALTVAAEQALLRAKRNLLTLITVPKREAPDEIKLRDRPERDPVSPDYEDCMAIAYEHRPEYLRVLRTIEREDIRVAYADNQTLPQLDLKASYGLNGLEDSYSESWQTSMDRDYVGWSVGLELKVPLFGGRKQQSEARAARMRRTQALKRMKAVETRLANEMDTAIGLVHRARMQVENYKDVVQSNEELWRVEEARFRAGKSTSRMLLSREVDYLKARESLLDSRLAYQFALIHLKASQGVLLEDYGIEAEKPREEETL